VYGVFLKKPHKSSVIYNNFFLTGKIRDFLFCVTAAIFFKNTLTAGANLEFSATSSKEASVAQLVEHHLAKVDVESSNLFARSIF
jgi:hypothetical protein